MCFLILGLFYKDFFISTLWDGCILLVLGNCGSCRCEGDRLILYGAKGLGLRIIVI